MSYKNTPIGKIPADWDLVTLKELISLEYGKGLNESQRKNGIYPVYGSNGIVGYHNEFLVKGPGIVVGRKGTIGAINWSDKNFWPIDTTYYVKQNGLPTDLMWLSYKLDSLNLAKLNMATGVPGLNRDLAYILKVSLPSLSEQKKIAHIISTADQAINKSNEIIAKTKILKKGIIQKILTKGIGHDDFKNTSIGPIPNSWELTSLNDIIEVQGGYAFKSKEYTDSGIPLIRISNVSLGNVELKDLVRVPQNYIKEYNNYALQEGDIVMALTRPIIGGGIKAGQIEEHHVPSLLNQRVGRLRILDNEVVSAKFLFWTIFSDNFINHMKKGLVTMNQPNISPKNIGKFIIPLPTKEEQDKIVLILSKVEEKLKFEIKRNIKLDNIKKGLMNDLLTGRKRVKINN